MRSLVFLALMLTPLWSALFAANYELSPRANRGENKTEHQRDSCVPCQSPSGLFYDDPNNTKFNEEVSIKLDSSLYPAQKKDGADKSDAWLYPPRKNDKADLEKGDLQAKLAGDKEMNEDFLFNSEELDAQIRLQSSKNSLTQSPVQYVTDPERKPTFFNLCCVVVD